MVFLPNVVRAKYDGDFRIRMTFDDGTDGTVDFRQWLSGPVFEPLKQVGNFRKFFVDGGTVAWPNGADIAPETLYEAAKASRSRSAQPGRNAVAMRRDSRRPT